ncbi:hypothetical protein FHP88_17355 [Sedimenticola selenatireducens]|uniref:Uncharacterized protein n=1 Tax=Sedimenticola selenatireducens TaxID=191960 RepID=A0A557RXX9_9GAMM|nr:hypothetical protein [Sedimenticola selenatireducens]TVO70013.1 hypothetical protein FHP88_17355 [Sedimenticola selenatireducens]
MHFVAATKTRVAVALSRVAGLQIVVAPRFLGVAVLLFAVAGFLPQILNLRGSFRFGLDLLHHEFESKAVTQIFF